MKKILVVYNCCGIGYDNIHMWSSHLNKIINQSYSNFDICISGCKISESSKEYFRSIKKNSDKKIILNFIEDILPVNITFNKSCMEASKSEEYDAFLYIASDVDMVDDTNVITKLVDLHFSDNIGMTSAVVNFDSGIEVWLGNDIFYNYLTNNNFQIPPGKTLNLHCMLFDRKIFDNYNNRIIPDIFRTYCTESIFFYINASLNLKYMIHNKSLFIVHLAGRDGSSVGFVGGRSWRDMYNPSIPVEYRLMTPEAKNVGFGYEEYINIFPHDPEKYNSDYSHKNPQELYEFIKKSAYLDETEFNYNNINFTIEL
jgi:hypothetical protein